MFSHATMTSPSLLPRLVNSALAALVLATGAVGVGCAASGEPLPQPELISFVTYYGGDPVAGPMDEGAAVSMSLRRGDAVGVSLEILITSAAIPETAEPLPQHVRLILGSDGPEPVGAHPKVLLGARLLGGEEGARVVKELRALPPAQSASTARLNGISMPGVTTRMNSVFARGIEFHQEALVDRQFGVELWQGRDATAGLSVALAVQDQVETILSDGASGQLQVTQVQRDEVLVLDKALPLDGSPLVLMTEPAFKLEGDVRIALILEAQPMGGAEPGLEDQVKRVRAEVRDAALEGTQRRQVLRLQERQLIRFQDSIDALADPATSRAALMNLASSTNSQLAGEFALLADDGLLKQFTDGLVVDRQVLRALASQKDELAWRLERDVLIELLEGLEEGTLGEEYSALLLQFTGDAGRQLGVVQDAIVASTSIATFRSRMIEDNKIALESSSSAARVRAADWLRTLSVTVPGYDPLGPAPERRQALRRWMSAAEGTSAAGPNDAPAARGAAPTTSEARSPVDAGSQPGGGER